MAIIRFDAIGEADGKLHQMALDSGRIATIEDHSEKFARAEWHNEFARHSCAV
jgi:hypothetical protein